MTLRAFRGQFLIAIDVDDADELEDGSRPLPATRDDLIAYLTSALVPVLRDEYHGNPVGFCSAELDFDTLNELPETEVRALYGKG
jgi:hypothetical protein